MHGLTDAGFGTFEDISGAGRIDCRPRGPLVELPEIRYQRPDNGGFRLDLDRPADRDLARQENDANQRQNRDEGDNGNDDTDKPAHGVVPYVAVPWTILDGLAGRINVACSCRQPIRLPALAAGAAKSGGELRVALVPVYFAAVPGGRPGASQLDVAPLRIREFVYAAHSFDQIADHLFGGSGHIPLFLLKQDTL